MPPGQLMRTSSMKTPFLLVLASDVTLQCDLARNDQAHHHRLQQAERENDWAIDVQRVKADLEERRLAKVQPFDLYKNLATL